jgi:hypothetical protein
VTSGEVGVARIVVRVQLGRARIEPALDVDEARLRVEEPGDVPEHSSRLDPADLLGEELGGVAEDGGLVVRIDCGAVVLAHAAWERQLKPALRHGPVGHKPAGEIPPRVGSYGSKFWRRPRGPVERFAARPRHRAGLIVASITRFSASRA